MTARTRSRSLGSTGTSDTCESACASTPAPPERHRSSRASRRSPLPERLTSWVRGCLAGAQFLLSPRGEDAHQQERKREARRGERRTAHAHDERRPFRRRASGGRDAPLGDGATEQENHRVARTRRRRGGNPELQALARNDDTVRCARPAVDRELWASGPIDRCDESAVEATHSLRAARHHDVGPLRRQSVELERLGHHIGSPRHSILPRPGGSSRSGHPACMKPPEPAVPLPRRSERCRALRDTSPQALRHGAGLAHRPRSSAGRLTSGAAARRSRRSGPG